MYMYKSLFFYSLFNQVLSLADNLLVSFETGTLTRLTQLRILHLSTNLLVSIDRQLLYGNVNLRAVEVRNNNLHWIEDDAFTMNAYLTHIDLSQNRLNRINRSLFRTLTHLEFLDLSQNMIEEIQPDLFLGLMNLKSLSLHENRLTNIDKRLFSSLINLSSLTLNHNYIRSIDEGAFANCARAEVVSLDDNHLTRLVRGMFTGLRGLTILNLQHNKIRQVQPGAFIGLPRIKELFLGWNKITELNKCSFFGLSSLIVLDLRENFISILQRDVFSALENLQELNLRRNRLEFVEADRAEKLTLLIISNNHISSMASVTTPLSLLSLDLYGNKFNCTCKFFRELAHLSWRNLATDCYINHGVLNFSGKSNVREKIWKRIDNGCLTDKCGKSYFWEVTPCVSCSRSNALVCVDGLVEIHHQCVSLFFEKAVSMKRHNSTECNNSVQCNRPFACTNQTTFYGKRTHSTLYDTKGEACLEELVVTRKPLMVYLGVVAMFIFLAGAVGYGAKRNDNVKRPTVQKPVEATKSVGGRDRRLPCYNYGRRSSCTF